MKKKFFAAFAAALLISSAFASARAYAEVAVPRGMPVRLLDAALEGLREPVRTKLGTIRFYDDDFGFTHAYGPGFVIADESGAALEVGRVLAEGATKAGYEELRDSLASYRQDWQSDETNELGFKWGGAPDEMDEIDVTMSEETDGDLVIWSCQLSSGVTEEVELWRVIFDGANGELWASRALFDGFASHDSATEKIFALEDEALRTTVDGSFVESDGWTREDTSLSGGMTLRTYRRDGAVAQYLIVGDYIRKSRWMSRSFKSPVPGIGVGTPEADLFGRSTLAEAREGAAGCGMTVPMLAKMGEGDACWYRERHGGSFQIGVAVLDGGRAAEFISVSSSFDDDDEAIPAADIAKMNELFEYR